MNALTADYIGLLARTLPRVIRSEKQNEQYIQTLEELEHRSDSWTKAEKDFAELLTLLIEDFEERNYRLKAATPREVLRELMQVNRLKQKDLAPIFGTESIVSEVLHGKRELNKKHIRRLSERFRISPEVFF